MRQYRNYQTKAQAEDRLGLVLLLSLGLHSLFLAAMIVAPRIFDFGSTPELPFEAMTVQLVGNLEAPAPAAPAAPVDPNLNRPDVVDLPSAEPVLPQPTPLDLMVTPPAPNEVIPIAERPPDTPPPVAKINEPPPKVPVPEKAPEKPPAVKKQPRANQTRTTNSTVEELRRKKEAEDEEKAIESKMADLARTRGRSNGTASENSGGSTSGIQIDPIKAQYYNQIKEIVRSNWVAPISSFTGTASNLGAVYVIVIQPNGRVSGKNLRRSSGNQDFDVSVEQAIVRSNFPPLPPVFEGQADNPALQFELAYLNRNG
ncbi:MAG: TonB C-terminal domain-containing protein [Deltaproteobacteria bacterium]|jgi:outer membrane biosynthesis protein TonB|nr:TonB C-terminal domain-containing protein [Deltaproteobacteria bacterium]